MSFNITKPTLLLDTEKCMANITNMVNKANKNNIDLRPHFKTHQSLEIGRWFKKLGVNKITVSSLDMAKYFAKEWNDITLAFPINVLEIDTINALAENITLNLLLESTESLDFLAKNLKHSVGCFIKIDVGYHRTGISADDRLFLDEITTKASASKNIVFKGFLAHAGHTYKCRTQAHIQQIHQETKQIMLDLKQAYLKKYPQLIISLGDTPSCSVAEGFTGIDEIRPGNFVFYDLTQNKIGSNSLDQIAVAMACPIVAKNKLRNELVIYGGSVHFSKDKLDDENEGAVFGRLVEKTNHSWASVIEGCYIKSLSQEHGIVNVRPDNWNDFKIGDLIYVLPVHSCLTANAMKSYMDLYGNIIDRM